MRFSLTLLGFIAAAPLALLQTSPAFSQAAGAPAGPATTNALPPQPGPPNTTSIPLPVPTDTTVPVEIPPPPTVNDSMLAPVPPAAHNIATWEEALGLLRSRSTDLRTAYDEVNRAEAQTRIALSTMLTQINGTAVYTHNLITVSTPPVPGFASNTSPIKDALGGGISAVQPLINVGNTDQIFISRINEDAKRLSVDDLKRTLALGVANSLVGVITAERVAELNRIGFRAALERLDLSERKKALGAANGLDVVRVRQDVETARASLVTGDESLLEAREALGLALGMPVQVGVTRDVNINGLERTALRVCQVALDVDQRADIAAARKNLEVAKRNVDNLWYNFLPTLNLQSGLATTSNPFALPATTWNIQAVLSVPIWDGGARYGNIHQANALQDEAFQQLEALRRAATIQIAQARRGVGVAEASRKVALDARAVAAEIDRLTQISYREGQSTSLELVISGSALRQADVNLALQDFGLVKARILAVMALATCPW